MTLTVKPENAAELYCADCDTMHKSFTEKGEGPIVLCPNCGSDRIHYFCSFCGQAYQTWEDVPDHCMCMTRLR